MRFKRVPDPPDDPATLGDARRAVPLVPDREADCCARLRDRLDLPDREAGRDWLALLRALRLVERVDGGYRRTREPPDDAAAAFRDRVYGAREALDALDAGPLDADGAFERVRDAVPAWERDRDPDWEATWRERTRRLLDWAVLLGLAERTEEGYVATDGTGAVDRRCRREDR
ncbi:MAG: hypothetical protein ABEJ34_04735 [Haloferacaceae archaeon]